MKALIIGATGATGKDLLQVLLQDNFYSHVTIFVRKATGIIHPKLSEVITDFQNLDGVSEFIQGDVLFSSLGTTLKAAGTKDNQRKIDYEMPLKFAEVAIRNSVKSIVLLSAYGASSTSSVFYSKIKGELEDSIEQLGFETYIIFRPGLLIRKDTDRPGEKTFAAMLKFFNRIGIFRKYKPLPTETLALKLAKAPKIITSGKTVVELNDVFGF